MEMLSHLVEIKQLLFQAMSIDGWYAAQKLMGHIDSLGKIYNYPLADRSRRLSIAQGSHSA
jgi:hypothetical protein